MNRWPYGQMVLNKDDITAAINDDAWQAFRHSLKGESTQRKLERLDGWLQTHSDNLKAKVQVQNYINALRRGGQLSYDNEVVR